MKIEIDQSGRIEYTSKPTVLAFSNSKSHSLILSASNKQYLQRFFRKAGKSKFLMIKTFTIMIYLLVKNELKLIDEIIIDREYAGYDRLIKDYLFELCEKNSISIERSSVHIRSIGKKSRAHDLAINAYRKKRADRTIVADDILKLLL